MRRTWRVAGVDFAHMHMGDNLRMARAHPNVEIVGICDEDPARTADAAAALELPRERVFTDVAECLEVSRPDLVILCPATADHAARVEAVAPFGVGVLIEKPFAKDLADADRMIAAMRASGGLLAINWPLAWYPPHVTAKRLIDAGAIGEPIEVHFYDGNRGPLWHVAHKQETSPELVAREKPRSWFYRRASGGGSLQDYLGYGTTLGTWFLGGRAPLEVTCTVDQPAGLEVDEHSITVARYTCGLSRFETRWGTFSDPWTHQPQPRCGFVLVGTEGTLASYDYAASVGLQTRGHPAVREVPVDALEPPFEDPVQHVLACLETGAALHGPLTPALCRIGQQIVDTAVVSAREKRTVELLSS